MKLQNMIKSKSYKKENDRNYMWAGGKRVYLYYPQPDDFDIQVIAASLSKICRFGSHTKIFYSVAYHSVLVSRICPPELKLHGLLHDASESYLGDIISPLKLLPEIRETYVPFEENFMKAIAKKFGFKYNKKTKQQIKDIEKTIVLTEIRDLMDLPDDEVIDLSNTLPITLDKEILPNEGESMFIDEYWKIVNKDIPY
jgi:hypothetical protein